MQVVDATLIGAAKGNTYALGKSLVFNSAKPTRQVSLEVREHLRKALDTKNNCLFTFGDPYDSEPVKVVDKTADDKTDTADKKPTVKVTTTK